MKDQRLEGPETWTLIHETLERILEKTLIEWSAIATDHVFIIWFRDQRNGNFKIGNFAV